MSVLVVIGTQWGDEGKGKIIDYISKKIDIVVRYQGGSNAGHSVKFGGKSFALNLLPSGIFFPNVLNVIANGAVVDLNTLVNEISTLNKQGIKISPKNFVISSRAHVVFPFHIEFDKLQEELKKTRMIGTTLKGIGPAYSDKFARNGLRVIDLYDEKYSKLMLNDNLKLKNPIFEKFGKQIFDATKIYNKLKKEVLTILKPFVVDTSILLNESIVKKKKILLEGAQGSLLCIEHGTYPYVTSSSPLSSYAPLGSGIPPSKIDRVLGIVKSYTTRVGIGAFPTEIKDINLQDYIRTTGNEYGVVTGRPRRVGWLDVVALKYAIRINGITEIALTLLDVLTEIKELKICVEYKIKGKKINYFPASSEELEKVEPVYTTFKGWVEDISKINKYNKFEKLPMNTKKYVKAIEKLLGVKISLISVGPDREQTIVVNKIFN